MKRILILILVFATTIVVHGQETINNFKIDNNEIVWQKVYDTSMSIDTILTFDQLVTNVKNSLLFEKIEISDNKILGELNQFNALFKEAGYNEMNCPMYIARNHIKCSVILDYKEGKYRVTVKKISLIQAYSDPISEIGQISSLNDFALRKGNTEIKPMFKKAASTILDYTFTKMFRFEKKNDNW